MPGSRSEILLDAAINARSTWYVECYEGYERRGAGTVPGRCGLRARGVCQIVGWSMSHWINLVIDALTMAIESRQPEALRIDHSDRGAQDASDDFRDELEKDGIRRNMSARGNCYDNAVVESFFRLLKREWVNRARYRTRDEAKADIFEYIECFYNRKRPHSYRGNISPVAFEKPTTGQNETVH